MGVLPHYCILPALPYVTSYIYMYIYIYISRPSIISIQFLSASRSFRPGALCFVVYRMLPKTMATHGSTDLFTFKYIAITAYKPMSMCVFILSCAHVCMHVACRALQFNTAL